MPIRVLVTGGAGFVGSHIVDRLVEHGEEVLVIDDLSSGKTEHVNPKAKLQELDIRDRRMTTVARSFRPHALVHCAAQKSVPASMADPKNDADINIMGGLNVARAAIDSGCAQFTYVTTGGALYGEPDYLPCDEDHPLRPISAYGLSKWTFEMYARILLASFMQLNVLRLANVYGPRQDPDGEAGVVAIFSKRMLRGQPITIHGDGEQTRDFIYAADVARACEMAQLGETPVTINVGSGVGTSINDLVKAMSKETCYALRPAHDDEQAGDVKRIYLDNSRARRLIGWVPQTFLEDGLRQTLAWFGLQET
jgi:UDP-glucose 4-epimerase